MNICILLAAFLLSSVPSSRKAVYAKENREVALPYYFSLHRLSSVQLTGQPSGLTKFARAVRIRRLKIHAPFLFRDVIFSRLSAW